jgi:hypothetical protein
MMRWVLFLLLALCVGARPAAAQTAEDVAEAGRMGAAAAGGAVVPAALLGTVGGVLLGVSAGRYFGSQRDETGVVVPAIGAGVLLTGWTLGGVAPRRTVPGILETEAERQAYRQAYVARAQRRQRDALLIGTLVGIGAGVALHSAAARWTR